MTMVGKTLVGLTAAALMAAGPVFASPEVDKELAEMRQMVDGLKDQVEAQQEQLEHQGGLLEDAQKVVREQQEEESQSALGEFWEAVDVGLSVATSYSYNFANPDNGSPGPGAGVNQGVDGFFYPFHPDHNQFVVDQVWLNIGKPSTAESRAGFMFTVLYGNTASFLGQGANLAGTAATSNCPTCPAGTGDLDGDGIPDVPLTGGGTSIALAAPQGRRAVFDSTSDYYVHQAFISYMAPVGEGIEFDVGKMATPIGMETADASVNWNVTRGNVYNFLQPIDHLGIIAKTTAGPVSFKGGVVNEGSLSVSSPDINKEKSYLGGIGFAPLEGLGLNVNVLYGAEGTGAGTLNGQRTGLVDGIVSWSSDVFSAWVNADYLWVEGSQASAWGVALAGLVPITEELSIASRLEYVADRSSGTGTGSNAGFGLLGTVGRADIYGVTGTVAYELAEHLTLKGEVRWDKVFENTSGVNEFVDRTGTGNTSQIVGLGQLVYAF